MIRKCPSSHCKLLYSVNGKLSTEIGSKQFQKIHSRLGGEEDVDRFTDACRRRCREPEADSCENRDGEGDEIHMAFAGDLVVAEEADGQR